MKKLMKFFKENQGLGEFIRYLIIGFSTTFLNWGITIALKELTNLDASEAGNSVINGIAWTLSTVFFAFWMYKFFVFRSRSMKTNILWKEFAGFTGARLLTFGVETAIIYVFCDLLAFDHVIRFGFERIADGTVQGGFSFNIREFYIIKLCACVITTILNYIFSKVLIFKKGQKMSLDTEAETDEGGSAEQKEEK